MTRPRPRVLHVIYAFEIGGSEIVARHVVAGLPELEHGVVAIEHSGQLQVEFSGLGAETWFLDVPKRGKLGAMLQMHKIFRQFRPDVVHCHHYHELVYTLPAAMLTRTRIIHTEHEYYSLQQPKVGSRLRRLSRWCTAVTAVDEATAGYLAEEVGVESSKLHTIRNGIEVAALANARRDREAFGLGIDAKVIGSISRLEPVKGHETLVRAFAAVQQQVPEARLVLAGDGSLRQHLERLTKELGVDEKVQFLGTRRDIPEILAIVDVIALCSIEEGLPMSLLEAFAASKPIVATAVGGIPTVVIEGETGILVQPKDVQATATALHELLTNSDRARELGRNGNELIRSRYDIAQSVARYRELYEG